MNNIENQTVVVNEDHSLPHLSWSAILGGVLLTMAIHSVLILIGFSLGMASLDLDDGSSFNAELFSWSSSIWYLLSVVLSLFAGGYVAGRFSGNINQFSGVFNGLMVWALGSFITLYLVTSGVGQATKGVGKALNYGVSSIGDMVPSKNPFKQMDVLDQLDMNTLSEASENLNEFLKETDNQDIKRVVKKEVKKLKRTAKASAMMMVKSPQNIDKASSKLKKQIQSSAKRVNSELDIKEVISAIAEKTTMSEEEVKNSIKEWNSAIENWTANLDEKVKELKEQSLEMADEVTEALALFSGLAALSFLLGAASSAFGGFTGRRRVTHDGL